jgi:putative spermidine/putrescine transport system permease protein
MTSKLKYILFAGICSVFVFPFLFLPWLSLANNSSDRPLFSNWSTLFSAHSSLMQGFVLSLTISIAVAMLATALGFVISRTIAFHQHSTRLLFAAYLPYIFSPVIYAACIYYFFVKFGLAGTSVGVVVAQFMIAFPFSVILFSGYWNQQLKAMEQLAATLGSRPAQTFLRVLIPVSRPMLLVCFFQTFLISWFEYGLTAIIGVGKIQTLTIKVYQYVNEANPHYAAVASCLLIVPPAIFLWFNKRYLFKKPS